MATIDTFIPAIGLVVVLSNVTTISYVGRGRNRRSISNTVTNVSNGSGFIVDGMSDNYGNLRNESTSEFPIVVSVAHVIPTQGVNRYFFKLFDTAGLSKIYELNLIAYNRSADICIFNFITPITDPLCLRWNLDDLKPGMPCYVGGFPLGDAQLSIVDGVVRDPTYCFSNLATGIDQIYHSAPVTNGNSGSCILDISGSIIGIHAWGYNQNANGVTFENFCGGPANRGAYTIISMMMFRGVLDSSGQKYYPRYGLGIECGIVNDIFRIIKFDNPYIRNTDGIIINKIIPNQGTIQYAIDTYNKTTQLPKIAVNDMITEIQDLTAPVESENEFIKIGYSEMPPGILLFQNTASSSPTFKIKIRKAPQYDVEHTITLNNILLPESVDLDNKII